MKKPIKGRKRLEINFTNLSIEQADFLDKISREFKLGHLNKSIIECIKSFYDQKEEIEGLKKNINSLKDENIKFMKYFKHEENLYNERKDLLKSLKKKPDYKFLF